MPSKPHSRRLSLPCFRGLCRPTEWCDWCKEIVRIEEQFEMTEALKQIAMSGSNNSTVFIPAGPSGIPLVGNTLGDRVQP